MTTTTDRQRVRLPIVSVCGGRHLLTVCQSRIRLSDVTLSCHISCSFKFVFLSSYSKHVKVICTMQQQPIYRSSQQLRALYSSYFSTVLFIGLHAYCRLYTLSQKKTHCYPLPTTPKNITALPRKMHNFFI